MVGAAVITRGGGGMEIRWGGGALRCVRRGKRAALGDKRKHSNGYTMVFTTGGWQLEHRLVMEKSIGRRLLTDESVHHRNGDRTDNRITNLELWVRPQPCGVRVEEAVQWAREILARYGSEVHV